MIPSDFAILLCVALFGAGCVGVGILLGRAIERDQSDWRAWDELRRAEIGWQRRRR